jgi:DNA replication protein DnaC
VRQHVGVTVHTLLLSRVSQERHEALTDFDFSQLRIRWFAAQLGAGECALVKVAKSPGLVVLDEIGFEADRDGLIFEILDARYRSQSLTWCTSGLTEAQWVARYGLAAWRRLTEGGTVVDVHQERKEGGQ